MTATMIPNGQHRLKGPVSPEEAFDAFHAQALASDNGLSPLEEQEQILDTYKDYIVVGEAYEAIMSQELYRERGHRGFRDWTEARGAHRSLSYRYIHGAQVARILQAAGLPIPSLDTTRALAVFLHSPETVVSIWTEALARSKESGRKHTSYVTVDAVINARAAELGPKRQKAGSLARRRAVIELAKAGHTSKQIAERLDITLSGLREIVSELAVDVPADLSTQRRAHPQGNRIIDESLSTLEGIALGLGLIDYATLDPDEAAAWLAALGPPLSALHTLRTRLKELAHARTGE